MPVPNIPPEFDDLSTPEKIEYVQKLWERIAQDADAVELTDEQRDELDRRLEAHRQSPEDAVSWAEVRKRLRSKE